MQLPSYRRTGLYSLIFLCAGLILSSVAAQPPTDKLPVLTRVEEIHKLSSQEADRSYPVQVHGVVTYYDPDWSLFFLQDATGGIYIYHTGDRLQIQAGDSVKVEGFTGGGRFTRMIVGPHVTKLEAALVLRPKPGSLAGVLSGEADSQWIEIVGCVQSVARVASSYLEMEIGTGGKHCRVIVPGFLSNELPMNLVDARVRVSGVGAVTLDKEWRAIGGVLYVKRVEDITVVEAPPEDPFAIAVASIDSLPRLSIQDEVGHRIQVQGVVTHERSGKFLFVQDQTGGMMLEASTALAVQLGERLDVVGFVDAGGYSPLLRDVLVRRAGLAPALQPIPVTASEAIAGAYHSRLISLEARVLQQSREVDLDILSCSDGNKTFVAELQRTGAASAWESLRPNTLLRLSGVCFVHADTAGRAIAFRVLLRSREDIVVLKMPPWWTVNRVASALAIVSGILLVSGAWIAALQRQMRAQTLILRKRLEREAALEEKYRGVVENANDIIYTIDLAGKCTSVNAAGERISGYTRQELTSMNIVQIVAPEFLTLVQGMMARKLAGKSPGPYEIEIVTRDGRRVAMELSTRLILKDGKPVEIQGIARDFTERRHLEEDLRQSEERFSKAFRATPVSIAISKLADGRIVDVNEGFVELFGFSRDEIIGQTASSLGTWVNPEDRAQLIQRLQFERSARDVECRLRTKSGQILETLVSAERIELDNEPCVLSITYDLTERLRLENQLRHSQKMDAVGQLASGIAHDFNNIMTIIQGHTSLLLAKEDFSTDTVESLKRVLAASERAANLTRQLLAFSRKQVMQPKRIDLNQVLSAVLKMLQRLLGEHISIESHCASALPAVYADTSMIEQMIINLAVNARDAMPKGGVLTITTSCVELNDSSRLRNAELRAGPFVCVSVADTGCGIDAAILGKIFEPFFTTKQVGKGSGLGLSIVYGIMKQHQGWVEVTSEIGKGTNFKLFFPGESKPVESPTPIAAEPSLKGGIETILVVEDDSALRHLVCSLLRHQGYRVLEAASGREALDSWRQHGKNIDLLLTDLIMPGGITGFELGQQLQSEKTELKTIFTSGYPIEGAPSNVILTEGVNFLPKPYYPPKLAQMARDALDRKQR